MPTLTINGIEVEVEKGMTVLEAARFLGTVASAVPRQVPGVTRAEARARSTSSTKGESLAGASGVPVFTPVGAPGIARLMGPTGGYLIAYPAAAFVAGTIMAKMPSFVGRSLAAPPHVPADLVKQLQTAFDQTFTDPAFQQGLKESKLAEEVYATVATMEGLDPYF